MLVSATLDASQATGPVPHSAYTMLVSGNPGSVEKVVCAGAHAVYDLTAGHVTVSLWLGDGRRCSAGSVRNRIADPLVVRRRRR